MCPCGRFSRAIAVPTFNSEMSRLRKHLQDESSEEGFTLIELTVAMLIGSIALIALAGALTSGLRSVAIQKSRTQGNEVATEGIEDLQRYDYDHLGVCNQAPNPPAGFGTPAQLANCTAAVYADPCSGNAAVTSVPRTSYTCTRRGIEFTVNRYVAYGDAAQTSKRLAVVVTWIDAVGRHEVSQQSSLRSPTRSSVIGVSPPAVTTATVNPSVNTLDAAGHVSTTISLEATTQGVATTDQVTATFKAIVDGAPNDITVTLSSGDGINWTALLDPATYQFGVGSQFIYFTAVRNGDGKGNSRVAVPAATFCPSGGCSADTMPSFQGTPTMPATAEIDPAGILQADVPVSISTANVSPVDRVTMIFQTQAGAYSVALQPNTSCTVSTCTWNGSISAAAGYRFAAGAQTFYFTAAQVVGGDYAVDQGSTAATAAPTQVTFR